MTKINQLALVTTALTDLIGQVHCYKHDLKIFISPQRHPEHMLNTSSYSLSASDGDSYNLAFLVDESIRGIIQSGGDLCAVQIFNKWVFESIQCEIVKRWSRFKVNNYQQSLEDKKKWEKTFNRNLEEELFISDPLVPRGFTHYRYVYRYDHHRRIYKSTRETFNDESSSHHNEYWFDYFGPEEDELGLIFHIDY